MRLELTAVFRKVPEGLIGFVEELPGANTQAATLEEARANLREAVTFGARSQPGTRRAGLQVKILIIVERTASGFSAYSPDVEGCIATGATREEIEKEMREAIEFHFEGLREHGDSVPSPHSYATYVEVAA